jgi:hypothetical protein
VEKADHIAAPKGSARPCGSVGKSVRSTISATSSRKKPATRIETAGMT